MVYTKHQIVQDLLTSGVKQGILLHVKVSMRSIGSIKGGSNTLIEALLEAVGPEGTIISDGFIESYPLPLSIKNSRKISTRTSPSYAGAFANAMIKHPGMHRSRHPIQRFVAVGAKAQSLMESHTPDSEGYWIMEKLASMGAYNLNIGENIHGVGTTHVAIEKTGLKKRIPPRGVNYVDASGNITLFKVNWNGGCAKGFIKFVALYKNAGLIRFGKVGNSGTLLTKMEDTLNLELSVLKDNPAFFFCDDPTCKDCRLRWQHSTGCWLKVKFYSAVTIIRNKL